MISLLPDPKVFILFSQRNSISRFLVDTYDSPDITLPIPLKNIKALDYDPVDHFVYWVEGRSKSIRKSHVNGTKVSYLVTFLDLSSTTVVVLKTILNCLAV